MPSMSQEDVLSFLGINVDNDPSSTNSSSTQATFNDEESEIPAMSGENCVDEEGSEYDTLLTDSGGNTSQAKIVAEENVNGTSNADISKGSDDVDASESTPNDVDGSDKSTASDTGDKCGEKDSLSEKKNVEVPNSSQNTLDEPETQKDSCEDETGTVLLDGDAKDDKEDQSVNGKVDADSKIGKISIKKIEDLCDKGAGKEEKNVGSKGDESEVVISDSSSEGK